MLNDTMPGSASRHALYRTASVAGDLPIMRESVLALLAAGHSPRQLAYLIDGLTLDDITRFIADDRAMAYVRAAA